MICPHCKQKIQKQAIIEWVQEYNYDTMCMMPTHKLLTAIRNLALICKANLYDQWEDLYENHDLHSPDGEIAAKLVVSCCTYLDKLVTDAEEFKAQTGKLEHIENIKKELASAAH